MAEQTFKSPGFFEREIDLSQRDSEIVGVPAGVVGTAEMGPAFVPVTIGSFADFERKFGSLSPEKFGPYAVREFLKHKTALTYVRVLGAGSNSTTADFSNTIYGGIVKGAGFKIIGSLAPTSEQPSSHGRYQGCVQFLAARHIVQNTVNRSQGEERVGYPIFSQNRSYDLDLSKGDDFVYLTRAMLFTPTGSRFEILSYASASYATTSSVQTDTAMPNSSGMFKLVLHSIAGADFASTDGFAGIKIFTASLDPQSPSYIGKVLNTDPQRFGKEQHLLYADFPVETELATVDNGSDAGSATALAGTSIPSIALLSGSQGQSDSSGISGITYLDGFGRFDTRYRAPKTSYFISQPYGNKEYDLFRFECISDGAIANEKFKVSITNLRKSNNPANPYGTFTVQVRSFSDTDTAPQVLESYNQCSLDPNDKGYIAKKIGDFKPYFNFDAELESERKMMVSGKYPNNSNRIRVIMNPEVEKNIVPSNALPFGFRGFGALKTNDTLTDSTTGTTSATDSPVPVLPAGGSLSKRLTFIDAEYLSNSSGIPGDSVEAKFIQRLTGSILPPVPMRFKVTRGEIASSGTFVGRSGGDERVDARYYWGAKFTRLPLTGTLSNALLRSNESTVINPLFRSYSKMLGIEKLDMVVTGAGADEFNENKFTLARVALPNKISNNSAGNPDLTVTANSHLTGTAKDHILNTAYIRNGIPDSANYTITDPYSGAKRITFASLMTLTSSVYFNRFTNYAKFTNFFYGGFDGLNTLNTDMSRMNDRSCSSDTGGMAAGQTLDIGLDTTANDFGSGKNNSIVSSYRVGAKLLTDQMASRVNIVTIPGLRDPAITDYVFDRLSDYSKAFYVADIPTYNADGKRLFLGGTDLPNVSKTSELFSGRAIDNNYSAVYFPDVTIDDPINNRPVQVPASVAVMGALAYNDSVAYPWFAPAGFNRAALDFVSNVKVRLNQGDRDLLYEDRINPISTFPQAGYVIFGQKTLQLSRSALDRVNVRRMLLEVKRIVSQVAEKIVFEQNTPATRARFVAQVTPLLSTIQSQQGIDQFKVVMDSTNNTQEDIESNILNGKIVVVPTRAVEFVAIDFIITNAGVSFE